MSKHKYLTDAGIKPWPGPDKEWKKDKRLKVWKTQRKKYGFDERQTWDMDDSAAQWLYERLCMFNEVNVVATDKEQATYDKLVVDKSIWEIKSLDELKDFKQFCTTEEVTTSLQEPIDLMMKYLRHYLKTDSRQRKAAKKHSGQVHAAIIREYIDCRELKQALHIFADIAPALWW